MVERGERGVVVPIGGESLLFEPGEVV